MQLEKFLEAKMTGTKMWPEPTQKPIEIKDKQEKKIQKYEDKENLPQSYVLHLYFLEITFFQKSIKKGFLLN